MPAWRRTELRPGLYDEPVTQRLAEQIAALTGQNSARSEPLSNASRAAIQAWLIEALELAVDSAADEAELVSLSHEILALLAQRSPRTFPRPAELQLTARHLHAVIAPPSMEPKRPVGSLHASSLLVNASGERLIDHLRSEFDSADRIDLLCAFIKLSGIEKLRSELERHCSGRGRPLRVLTTTYMGASDAKAIERLAGLPNAEVKISYDESATRLHAKAWIFHRDSGYSTAYIGSSNLSHAAQTDGIEWNVRLTEQGQPALLAQMAETFEQYWADPHQFEIFRRDSAQHSKRLARALSPDRLPAPGVLIDIEPKDYQRPILDELQQVRLLGRHRNLLVAATGTGKTVMAALDYQRLRQDGGIDTLLFVAHRREILDQSRQMFRNVLQQAGFGELLCDGLRPDIGRHVFASVMSLIDDPLIDPASFDMVIIDEAHHAPAASWERLLDRIKPKELLGLTGTPERTDGLDHERHFPRPWVGNLRVWNAIPHALVPFRYYMLDIDGVDLSQVAWRAGKYVPEELSGRLVGAAEIYVSRGVSAMADRIAHPAALRAIAFCVDVRHAEEINRCLLRRGLRSQVLSGQTPTVARQQARFELDAGRIQVLCVVDIYNEGVDVPNVNALFFFRPTESATVFLQQLGRGLRRARDKAELVIFDLTGRQHLSFRFDRKLRALLGHTPRELREFVGNGLGRLPAGCHLHFDERARSEVLDQIRRAIPSDRPSILLLLRDPAHAELSLDDFLHETDIELDDLYRKDWCWALLRRAAGLERTTWSDDETRALQQVCKLIHVGDACRLNVWQRWVALDPLLAQSMSHPGALTGQAEAERRVIRMLYAVLYGKEIAATPEATGRWIAHSSLRAEMGELIPVLRRLNALLTEPHQLSPEVPLLLHARYLGVELSAAFDQRTARGHFRDYYTGVESVANGRYDLLLVTLQKSAATKEHLRYRDFPLASGSFHWQSKARTTLDSKEGKRHIDPQGNGMRSLLLVREQADRPSGLTGAFQYLGPVRPSQHHGERPVTVEWALDYPMPAALLQAGRVAA